MKYIRLKNLVIDWDTMGCSKKQWNSEGRDGNGVFVKNGKLFGFSRNENGYKIFSEYCVENEKNYTKEKVWGDYFNGFGYESSPLYRDWGMCVENGEVELFDDLDELEKIKIMSDKEYKNKVRYEKVEDWLYTLKGEFNSLMLTHQDNLEEWKNGLDDKSYSRFRDKVGECISSIETLDSTIKSITWNINK